MHAMPYFISWIRYGLPMQILAPSGFVTKLPNFGPNPKLFAFCWLPIIT